MKEQRLLKLGVNKKLAENLDYICHIFHSDLFPLVEKLKMRGVISDSKRELYYRGLGFLKDVDTYEEFENELLKIIEESENTSDYQGFIAQKKLFKYLDSIFEPIYKFLLSLTKIFKTNN